MESGLKKAETNAHEAKLFKISGGMRPVMQEVDMAWSSMNHGDVFVLDSGKKISFSFFHAKYFLISYLHFYLQARRSLCGRAPEPLDRRR